MKKILVVSKLPIWSMQKNQGSKSIQQTLVGYAKNEYEVHYLTSSNASSDDIDDEVITVHNFRLPLNNLKSDKRLIKLLILKLQVVFFYIFGIINTLKYAKRIEPDVLYGFEVHGAFVTSITSRILNIPNINRFMGTILVNKLDSALNRILYFDHFLGLKAPARMRIMTNDGTKGDEVLKRLNAYDSNTLFLLNGIDVKSLDRYPSASDIRNSFGISNDKFVFLTVSRLASWKRVDRAIRIISQIKDELNCQLIIVGDGSEKDKLEKLVRDLNIEELVRFEGSIEQEKLPLYYKFADVFLSLYELSNLGNPLIEAISYGKLVITLNNGGTSSIIKDNYNGILIEEDRVEEIPNIILDVVNNEELKEKLKNNARLFAQENFYCWDERMRIEIMEVEKLIKGV